MGHAPLFCDPCFAQFSQVAVWFVDVPTYVCLYVNCERNCMCVHVHIAMYILIQDIGLASLGISDEWVEKLASVRLNNLYPVVLWHAVTYSSIHSFPPPPLPYPLLPSPSRIHSSLPLSNPSSTGTLLSLGWWMKMEPLRLMALVCCLDARSSNTASQTLPNDTTLTLKRPYLPPTQRQVSSLCTLWLAT